MQLQQKNTKPTFRAEREFGLLVGAVLLLLGGWWLYRGHWPMVAKPFAGLGSVLILFGALFPKALVVPNRAWMGLAKWLSLITTPIILGLVYFLIIMPIGVVKRMFGWDPLRRRAPAGTSYWTTYNARQRDPQHFEKMF
jgi:hypothetical protein